MAIVTRAQVTHRYAVKVRPVASELDACLSSERWIKMLRRYAKNEGQGGKVGTRVINTTSGHATDPAP